MWEGEQKGGRKGGREGREIWRREKKDAERHGKKMDKRTEHIRTWL